VIFKTEDSSCIFYREWDPKNKIINTSFIIFSLCIADLVFPCKNIQEGRAKLFFLEIHRVIWESSYPGLYADFKSEETFEKNWIKNIIAKTVSPKNSKSIENKVFGGFNFFLVGFLKIISSDLKSA
jgi:hypothetical protein